MTSAFPSSHTTTTTTVTASDDRKLYMNTGFLRTQHGFLKMFQMLACFLGFICVMAAGSPYNSLSEADYISFVTVCGILISGILLFLYFINAVVFLTVIPWLLMELIYNGLWCFFCFVGGIVGATYSSKYSVGDVQYAASAFFLFLAMCFYGYYGFRLYLLYKQNVRLVIVTTETMTTTTVSGP